MPSENVYEHGKRQIAERVAEQEQWLKDNYQVPPADPNKVSPEADHIVGFTSYSGCDIRAIVHFFDPNATPEDKSRVKILGDVQTITFSTHREKFPVRTLGRTTPKGYTRGPRTIGGTLIFTVFNKEVLSEMLVQNYQTDSADRDNYGVWAAVLVDQIPPFEITISFVNEYGAVSRLALYGVELVNEGQTMSIDDLITENVCTFVARHIEPMYDMRGDGPTSWEDVIMGEKDFDALAQDVRVRRLLAAMEGPEEVEV
jgi:hypothetical protein